MTALTVTRYVRRDGKRAVLKRDNPRRARYFIERHCWHCGVFFLATRKDARYCSGRCRQAAKRRRDRLAVEIHNEKMKRRGYDARAD